MILEDFDECRTSTFEPSDCVDVVPGLPKIGISCFSKTLIDRYVEIFNGKKIAELSYANGKVPVYKIEYKGVEVALYMSAVGAAACTVMYEEILAMGLEKLILFGTCGVLDKDIEDLAIIIPNRAIRDEGTSYHYVKASDEIVVNEKYIPLFVSILDSYGVSYIEGKVWTTDAPYRETRLKMIKRKEQGCVCVDMECSAMNAVAKFRGKDLFQFFYAADNLDSEQWEERSLSNEDRLDEKEKIIYLVLDLVLKINK